ncbi:MAG TPA: hypothetical protein VHY84_15425 [Bryobacteraceae bacterium]|nr:hypothetical protein [Bryobacteraceae bacterium]
MGLRLHNRFVRIVAAATIFAAGAAQAQKLDRPATVSGHPNLNGIWQALNTAYWNLEGHSIEGFSKEFGQLGAIGVIPAGQSVLKGGGTIPYLPAAQQKRNDNRSKWPEADPEAKCYMLGVPRVTYQNMPFQISEGNGDLLMVYPFAATNRIIYMKDHSDLPVDSWMGKSNGTWEGNVLVVTTTSQNGQSWLDRAGNFATNQLKVTERFRLLDANHIWYEATMEDPQTFSKPWTIEMPLYRLIDNNVQLLEHKCVPYADQLLYHDLLQPKQ